MTEENCSTTVEQSLMIKILAGFLILVNALLVVLSFVVGDLKDQNRNLLRENTRLDKELAVYSAIENYQRSKE